jgi:hypothetical protein
MTIAEAATPKVPMNVCVEFRRCEAWVCGGAMLGVVNGSLLGMPLCARFGALHGTEGIQKVVKVRSPECRIGGSNPTARHP